MALMIRKEGIESYGLYMQFSDTLHTIGGYQEYNFDDICLMLGHTKKLIKAKLLRVLNDYGLFDFYADENGVEFIGLETLKEDIEALNKKKINGAKGGRKRAENYKNKKEVIEASQGRKEPKWTLPSDWDTLNKISQLSLIDRFKESKFRGSSFIDFLQSNLKEELK